MKHAKWLATVCALALMLTGCSLDMESLLKPPAVGGQQQAVQAALETYIRDTTGTGRYTAKYPVEGDHTAAFLLCDGAGLPVDEGAEPALALAFYSLSASPDMTRINLLQKNGDEWVSVADVAGSGADIRQVAFGDLNADGAAELITGWTTYNDRSHRLAVFSVTDGLTLLDDSLLYTALYVGDLTATQRDSLLLLTVAGGETVTASLYRMEDGRLTATDAVLLDGYINNFGSMTLCRLAEGVHGLFVEGSKAGGSVVTELIYYDETGLNAPFYDPDTNTTPDTTRSRRLAARDIDGDAMVEIPLHKLLPNHTEADVGGTVTLWRTWDYATRTWSKHSYTLVNTVDGYMVTLDDWRSVNTEYNEQSRTLVLMNHVTRDRWLWLTVGDVAPDAPAEGLKLLSLFDANVGERGYYAWYDPNVVEAEKIGYMVTRLTGRGG